MRIFLVTDSEFQGTQRKGLSSVKGVRDWLWSKDVLTHMGVRALGSREKEPEAKRGEMTSLSHLVDMKCALSLSS